jgi:rhodanese-related sulfurtransferase
VNEDYISPHELRRQLDTDQAPTVIDVRSAEEYAAGHIPGARHIPGDEVERRLDEIPGNRPVVPY